MLTLHPTPFNPARGVIHSKLDTPHVTVDGHELDIADLHNHNNSAFFYGRGCTVRIDDKGSNKITVLAVTVRKRPIVRVYVKGS